MVQMIREIKSCKDCDHFKEENPYSTDGWDFMIDWMCYHPENETTPMNIAGAVEWHEERKIPIPDWCKFRSK